MRGVGRVVLGLSLLLAAAGVAEARDWFVRAGAAGDGSQASPFGDPWEALAKCESGDVVHIAAGRYTGRLQTGQWTIPFDNIQVLGGYSPDWSARDPWTYHAELVYDRTAKNWPKDARLWINVQGCTIDGLVIDAREQNEYEESAGKGRRPKSLDVGDAALRATHPVTVRNCVFVNTGREAIVCAPGSVLENNLFCNTCDSAVKVRGPENAAVTTINQNTFVWSWCDRAPGSGRYSGAGVHMTGPAKITGNIFAHCDNNAIYCSIKPKRSSVENNVFFMNLWSNFKMFIEGRDVPVDDASMELLEECGLKGCDDNEVLNPGLPLDAAWLDGAARRTAGQPGKVVMDDWNKLRQSLGLPLHGTGGAAASGIAPAYPLAAAMRLMAPTATDLTAGARVVPLTVSFSAGAAATGPAKSYAASDITGWARTPDTVDGQRLELRVAISNVGNINTIPAAYDKKQHEGIWLHDAEGQVRVLGFFKQGTAANRVVNEFRGHYNGSGQATRLFVVQGVAHALTGVPKAGFFIESIVPYEAATAARVRAVGRDWFVRAGAKKGKGTKDKPFRDPYQALALCEAGDTIHVTGGEYVGRLKMGVWKVDCADIALLGGYADDFSTRDPWANPSLLYTPADFKGTRNNSTFEGTEDHSGCVVDGFVFDKQLCNQYDPRGDLMYSQSEKKVHLWLSRPGCVVRNCVFVNGSEGAIRIAACTTVENCIFLNHYQRAVKVESGHDPETPFVFRRNTVAFAWEPKFGEGHGRQGDLLVLGGRVRAVVDQNVFEFADNHAIRLDADPKDVELTNNVFAHNLWAEVYRTTDMLVVDNATFASLRELGWKKLEGNALMTAGLPLEQKWLDVYLNRTAHTPGKVTMDDWNQLRAMLGQPVIATGGTAGTGVAPAYDWKLAMKLYPANPACKAGARPVACPVAFTGIARVAEEHEYAETTWEVAKNAAEWAKLDGQRVQLTIAVKSEDNQWKLSDIAKEQYAVWLIGGPEGTDSGGLPLRVYVKRGTRFARAFQQAKGYGPGKPEEVHVITGIARAGRQLVVEGIEEQE